MPPKGSKKTHSPTPPVQAKTSRASVKPVIAKATKAQPPAKAKATAKAASKPPKDQSPVPATVAPACKSQPASRINAATMLPFDATVPIKQELITPDQMMTSRTVMQQLKNVTITICGPPEQALIPPAVNLATDGPHADTCSTTESYSSESCLAPRDLITALEQVPLTDSLTDDTMHSDLTLWVQSPTMLADDVTDVPIAGAEPNTFAVHPPIHTLYTVPV